MRRPMDRALMASTSLLLVVVGIFAGLHIVSYENKGNTNDLASAASSSVLSPSSAPSSAVSDNAPMETSPSFFEDGDTTPEPVVVQTISTTTPDAAPASTTISARAYLVGDIKSGKIYLSSNETNAYPVASMSKLITAIVTENTLSSSSVVQITPAEAALPIDGSVLLAGERFTVSDLMYPMLISSSNVAAEALASSTSLGTFLSDMSTTAWKIGMKTAYFADPSGLNPHNLASAADMFALTRYLYESRPEILAYTRIPEKSFATTSDYMATTTLVSATSTATTTLVMSGHGAHTAISTHPFISDPRFLGGKTGRTHEAGETMLTILKINGRPTAFIVLGSGLGRRAEDTNLLIDKLDQMNI